MRDPRYDVLFEQVRLGPVTARNRFYQVPHCTGMGFARPHTAAAHRGVKAEGGWAVVSTEECEIHHSSDVAPYVEQRLWDDRDIPNHQLMIDVVHEHGALAAIELAHNGIEAPNLFSRVPTWAPSAGPTPSYAPIQACEMTKSDIREARRIYREAALRAKRAGFDIVYVYSGHGLTLPTHFLSRRYNQRSDEYGGALENRMRFLKEILEDAKEAVGDACAIAVRISVDDASGADDIRTSEESLEVIARLAELPDLWDVNLSRWEDDSATSRFKPEGFQQQYVRNVKSLTTKPVVGVGRFTSPDTMVAQIRNGVLDMIGAARPSIADPFLPKKIEEGRIDEIRECIGCNICVSGDYTMTPMRCTQNPTVGEEWRRGWHPENVAPAKGGESVLVVGGGPAGLECAAIAARRGCKVTLAEAGEEFGGRVIRESALPGLSAWSRVRDYRVQQIQPLTNVDAFLASDMGADDIAAFGASRIVIATGARWRRDGVGRWSDFRIEKDARETLLTPDDVMAGACPQGEVVIYDDDHFYMGGLMAEVVSAGGAAVTLVTPAPDVSHWTHNTLEQRRIQARLLELGVKLRCSTSLSAVRAGEIDLECDYSGAVETSPADSVVLVTSRISADGLFERLMAMPDAIAEAGIISVDKIGDCLVPGTIAAAVYSGRLWASELGEAAADAAATPFKRELSVTGLR